MISVIVVFPKLEEAKSIRNLLVRHGIEVRAACSTAAEVMQLTEDLDGGIVVSGYKMADMLYSELFECLPRDFEMVLVASQRYYIEYDDDKLIWLTMPIKAAELLRTVNDMYDRLYQKERKKKAKPTVRSEEERKLILDAKQLLMEQRKMTEQEAHKYLQRKSMDNGTNLVEMAQMVLTIFQKA
ncbi:MAG: ANTAR domain-containing protein [Eubacteriales bacterium]|nr:ANTAR domain-containing protein [Eubacteriales bacterium]